MNSLNSPPILPDPSPSPEEEDQLNRSAKRIPDVATGETVLAPSEVEMDQTQEPELSYKDKLMKVENPVNVDINMTCPEDDFSSDSESESETDTEMPSIRLSRLDKRKMQKPWRQEIIVKAFGKVVGYNFLLPRVKAQWKPAGKMDCVDIGDDFFVFKFENFDDYQRVVSDGPWFAGPYYLTIRKWEPMFSTTSVQTATTAVWAQLPKLPMDCYESSILERTKLVNL